MHQNVRIIYTFYRIAILYVWGGVNFITVGEDRGWASNLKVALRLIREEYILYLQEDYFLNKNIKWNELQRHISYCMSNEVDYLRLTFPYIFGKVRDTCYVENSLDQAYSVCLQAALWKKSVLSDLCIDGWSGWDFERNVASLIRERIPNFCFYGLSRSANGQVSYVKGTGVRKGKWTNSGYHFLSSNGFDYLLNNREKEPSYYMLLDVDGFWRPFAKIIWRFIHKLFF